MATQHWSSIQERGSYIGMRILLGCYQLLGRRLLWIALFPVVMYFYLTGSGARSASRQYLQRVYQAKGLSNLPSRKDEITHFCRFADSAFDKIDAWLGRITPKNLRYANREQFEQLVAQKQGAIFIGSHLGNLEVCRALSQRHQHCVINVLVFTHHAVEFNRMLNKINPKMSVNLIQVTQMGAELAILLKEKIDQGEFIVIVGDRTSTSTVGRVVYADFLGHSAPFSQGPFILAALLECPVYYLFCVKHQGYFHVEFERYSQQLTLPRKSRQQTLEKIVQDYANQLALMAKKYPYQWFNFYDFWQRDEHTQRRQSQES